VVHARRWIRVHLLERVIKLLPFIDQWLRCRTETIEFSSVACQQCQDLADLLEDRRHGLGPTNLSQFGGNFRALTLCALRPLDGLAKPDFGRTHLRVLRIGRVLGFSFHVDLDLARSVNVIASLRNLV